MKITLNVLSNKKCIEPKFLGVQYSSSKAYKDFYNNITTATNKNQALNINTVRDWFYKLAYNFNEAKNIDELTKLSKGLIEFLVSKNLNSMAGIICSILIKFNMQNQNYKKVEDLAVRGVAIARKENDIIHIAARCGDINSVLRLKEPGSDKHIKYLKIQNEALENICRNYDTDIIRNRSTNSRELAPLENYEVSLFNVKLDIANYALLKEPKYSKTEFEKAKIIYKKIKNMYPPDMAEKIDKKISVLEQKYKICGI